MTPESKLHYMVVTPQDEQWGIACTTVGWQVVRPHSEYPPADIHPNAYQFSKYKGRVLREYQMVYITEGEGYFESEHQRRTHVTAGTMMLLFPGEWHTYSPSYETGWKEYWVGFRGRYIDERVQLGFFTPEHPLVQIGKDIGIEQLYIDILRTAEFEPSGFQMLISSIVLHILGVGLFRFNRTQYESMSVADKIEKAKQLMRSEIGNKTSPEQIAAKLGVGYTWFRRMFKEMVGISPAQYQRHLTFLTAKELLLSSDLTISEIAYDLGFTTNQQFSTFFRQMEGVSPRDFRKQ